MRAIIQQYTRPRRPWPCKQLQLLYRGAGNGRGFEATEESEAFVVKEGIHPKTQKTKIVCGCGATYEVLSTKKQIHVEICANCHPFYTGSRSVRVEAGSRIDRFKKKYGR